MQECDNLPTEADKTACRDVINFKKGTEDHDYASCDKISRARNRQVCESKVTKYFVDFGDCQKIRDESKRDECLAKTAAVENAMVTRTAEAMKQVQETAAKTASA